MPLSVLVLIAQADPPRTVNDIALGTTEEFARRGPKTVCLEFTAIELNAGETSYLDYLGIHYGTVRISSPEGELIVKEGDAWARGRGGTAVANSEAVRIERFGKGKKSRYLVSTPTDYSSSFRPRVWIEGRALKGNDADLSKLERIKVGTTPPKRCDQRFDYGWDTLLGDLEE